MLALGYLSTQVKPNGEPKWDHYAYVVNLMFDFYEFAPLIHSYPLANLPRDALRE